MDEQEHHVHDLVAAYVLGAVTPDEAALVEQHLASCADCRRLESELREVESLLPHLAGEMAPPPRLKARLMAEITAEANQASDPAETVHERPIPRPEAPPDAPDRPYHEPHSQAAPTPLRPRAERYAARLSPLLAVAAALVLALVGVGVWHLISGTSQQPTHAYAMAGPSIKGTLQYFKDGNKLVLDLHGLKPLPAGRVYELWLVRTHGATVLKAVGVGEFRPRNGHRTLTISGTVLPSNVPSYNLAGLTIERAPRSLTPTLPMVASGPES